jgi:hypothetical protein
VFRGWKNENVKPKSDMNATTMIENDRRLWTNIIGVIALADYPDTQNGEAGPGLCLPPYSRAGAI